MNPKLRELKPYEKITCEVIRCLINAKIEIQFPKKSYYLCNFHAKALSKNIKTRDKKESEQRKLNELEEI